MGNSGIKGDNEDFRYQLMDSRKSWYPFTLNTKMQEIEIIDPTNKIAKIKFGPGIKYFGQIKREETIIDNVKYYLMRSHGQGKFSNKNEQVFYDGQWSEGRPHGSGYYQKEKFSYKGEFQKGKYHGQGKLEYSKAIKNDDKWSKYNGEFVNGLRQGKGYYQSRKIKIKGSWKSDELEGYGMVEEKNHQLLYYGNFIANKLNGYGQRQIIKDNGTDRYTGFFKDNYKHGFGVNSEEDGKIIYVGMWSKGKKEGEGIQKTRLEESYDIKQGIFQDSNLIEKKVLEWARYYDQYESTPYRYQKIQKNPLIPIIELVDYIQQDVQDPQTKQDDEIKSHLKLLLKY